MILDGVNALGPWTWIILGLVLIGLELLSPGIFLIWLGLAALATGAIDGMFGLSWQAAAILFAILSVASVVVGRRLSKDQDEDSPDEPFLNRRGAALVGRTFTLADPIENGEGRIRVDDSVWRITGPDLPAGAQVRVTRVDGATLVVEASPI